MAESAKPIVMLASMALLVAGGAVGFILMRSTAPTDVQVVSATPPSVVQPVPPIQPIQPSEPSPRTDERTEPGSAPGPSARPGQPRNRMARDVKREQIWSVLDREHQLEPAAPGSAAPKPEDAAALPELDAQYVKDALAEQLTPIVEECYESALDDAPTLAGKLAIEFTIVGAEEVGGIVEDAAFLPESTLDSAFVRECTRESLMAVSFEPPADGGRVQVTAAFAFEPDDE